MDFSEYDKIRQDVVSLAEKKLKLQKDVELASNDYVETLNNIKVVKEFSKKLFEDNKALLNKKEILSKQVVELEVKQDRFLTSNNEKIAENDKRDAHLKKLAEDIIDGEKKLKRKDVDLNEKEKKLLDEFHKVDVVKGVLTLKEKQLDKSIYDNKKEVERSRNVYIDLEKKQEELEKNFKSNVELKKKLEDKIREINVEQLRLETISKGLVIRDNDLYKMREEIIKQRVILDEEIKNAVRLQDSFERQSAELDVRDKKIEIRELRVKKLIHDNNLTKEIFELEKYLEK